MIMENKNTASRQIMCVCHSKLIAIYSFYGHNIFACLVLTGVESEIVKKHGHLFSASCSGKTSDVMQPGFSVKMVICTWKGRCLWKGQLKHFRWFFRNQEVIHHAGGGILTRVFQMLPRSPTHYSLIHACKTALLPHCCTAKCTAVDFSGPQCEQL